MARWHRNSPWFVRKPIQETFDYYTEIKLYPVRYPKHYGKLEIIEESYNHIKTKEFLNVSLDNKTDHTTIEVGYEIVAPTQISFKIVKGDYAKGITGSLEFKPERYMLNNLSKKLLKNWKELLFVARYHL